MVLDLEYEKLVNELKRINPNKVLVQLPEGIKKKAFEIQEIIEKLGIEVIFSGESVWGGCSLALKEAEDFGADLIVHFGHAEFIKSDFPVLYIEVKDNLNLKPILEKSLPELKDYSRIGLSYSIQHKQDIDEVIKFYEDNGKKVILSDKLGFAAYKGHVIGCEYRGLKEIENEIDCFVVIGNNFHSMGAAIAVEKPVFLIDVYNDEVKEMKGIRDKVIKQRAVSIEKLKNAEKVGVIVEIKPGQKFGSGKDIMKKLKEKNKEAVLISMSELTNEKLMNFYNIDCFIELACPRIAIDDFSKYEKTIVTYREALVALGEKSWEDFLKEGVV